MEEARGTPLGAASTGLFVVDTNVVVAGLITAEAGAPTARIFDAMLGGRLRFLLSEELLAEYREVFLRPKIAKLHGLGPAEIDEILVRLAGIAVVCEPVGSPIGTRGDQHLVALIEAEPRALLVSGDARLLSRVAPRSRSPRDAMSLLPKATRP